mmetsp:Transcript_54473/g.62429  ORF Transcript_54473/g.62429 Transcript_54473/m.62429 type:complete len:566 (-) Transcript_54473:1688-3385(-)
METVVRDGQKLSSDSLWILLQSGFSFPLLINKLGISGKTLVHQLLKKDGVGELVISRIDSFLSIVSNEPLEYCCPVTQGLMLDPVVASDGYNYDRHSVEKLLYMKKNSPKTNLPFPSEFMIKNKQIEQEVHEFKLKFIELVVETCDLLLSSEFDLVESKELPSTLQFVLDCANLLNQKEYFQQILGLLRVRLSVAERFPKILNLAKEGEGIIKLYLSVRGSHEIPEEYRKFLTSIQKEDIEKLSVISKLKGLSLLEKRPGNSSWVYKVLLDSKGRLIATGTDSLLRLWDLKTLNCTHEITTTTHNMWCMIESPNHQHLIIAGHNFIEVRQMEDLELCGLANAHQGDIYCIQLSPDGKCLVSGGVDYYVRFWKYDSKEGKLTQDFAIKDDQPNHIYATAFSPCGKYLAVAGTAESITIYEKCSAKKWEKWKTLRGHTSTTRCLVYFDSGKRIASGSFDGTIRLWNIEAGASTNTLINHSHKVISLTLSKDREFLVSTSSDHSIKIFDLKSPTYECLKTLHGSEVSVLTAAIADDNSLVISGDISGKLHFFGHGDWKQTIKTIEYVD